VNIPNGKKYIFNLCIFRDIKVAVVVVTAAAFAVAVVA
jgi:hypothetical protein